MDTRTPRYDSVYVAYSLFSMPAVAPCMAWHGHCGDDSPCFYTWMQYVLSPSATGFLCWPSAHYNFKAGFTRVQAGNIGLGWGANPDGVLKPLGNKPLLCH